MRNRYTVTLFACAVVSVIASLVITNMSEPPNDLNNLQNTEAKIITQEELSAGHTINKIIVQQDGDNELYDSLEIIFEDRDDIELINFACYGDNLYKLKDVELTFEDETLTIYMMKDLSVSADIACANVDIKLPSNISELDLTNSLDTEISIVNRGQAKDLKLILSYDLYIISGLYKNLEIWQVGKEANTHANYRINLNTTTATHFEIYSRAMDLYLYEDIDIKYGRIHSRKKGNIQIRNNELLNVFSFDLLQKHELEKMDLLSSSTDLK